MGHLSLYVGRAGSGKTRAAYEWIRDTLHKHPGEPIILLVPEAATYKAERDLAEFMQGGFTSVRVVGFNRLAYQVYQSLGLSNQNAMGLSKVGRNLLLRLAMKRCEGRLRTSVLAKALKQPQFSDVLQTLWAECQSFLVSTEHLHEGAHRIEEALSNNPLSPSEVDLLGPRGAKQAREQELRTLQAKLEGLASIFDAYEDLVDSCQCDDRDGLEVLIEALHKSPIVKGAHIVIDGFHWFTPLQYQLITGLIQEARDSVVTITLPEEIVEADKKRLIPGSLFARPYELYTDLKELSINLCGEEACVRVFKDSPRFTNPVIQSFVTGFFTSPQQKAILNSPQGLPLISAYNREREVDEVVRRALRLVQGQGESACRWRDIMIVLRDSETYSDLLEKAFIKYEVPYFIDQQRPMKTHPLAEFLTGLFEVVQFNYNHDSMMRLLKTDLIFIAPDVDEENVEAQLEETRNRIDELENYCLEFGVHHYKWELKQWPWFRKGPDGQPYSEEEARRHQRVNETHTLIMDWLTDWVDFALTHKGHTAKEWALTIFNVLEAIRVPDTLYQWSQVAEKEGQVVEKNSHEQMYQQVLNLLDEISRVGGEELLGKDDIGLLLEEGLSDLTYSMVPPSLDHVLVTTVERGYTQERQHVFVMGLNNGVFPRNMGEEGLIKDKERGDLARLGIQLAGGALVQSFNENLLFYLACSRGRASLTLSYAQTSGEGEVQEPALVIKRLQNLGYITHCHKVDLRIPTSSDETELPYEQWPEFSYMWRPMQSLSLLSSRWGELLDTGYLSLPWRALYNWALVSEPQRLGEVTRGLQDTNEVALITQEVVNGLFLPHHYMTGSVTRLEKYASCPFKFYSEYGLKLQPRKVANYGAPEIGTLLHDHLRKLGEELLAQGQQWRDLADLSEEERIELCKRLAADIAEGALVGYQDMDAGEASEAAYNKARHDRLVDTLKATLDRLIEWSQRSQFSTVALEKSFGMNDEDWPAVNVPLSHNRTLKLQGQIDRIDTWRDEEATYGLIVDYKTGSSSISASELYYGLKLQLLTYWMAYKRVKGHEHIIPAGTIYMPVKNQRISSQVPLAMDAVIQEVKQDKSLKNTGYFSDRPYILMKLDEKLRDKKSTAYVPLRLAGKSEDSFTINKSDMNRTKSAGDYEIMSRYVEYKMAQLGRAIGEGLFQVTPVRYGKNSACQYCSYKTICRFESKRNSYRDLLTFDESQALDRMRQDLGIERVDEGGVKDGD